MTLIFVASCGCHRGLQGMIRGYSKTQCSMRCDRTAGCLSFEYSPTRKICNLNNQQIPTQKKFQDYLFCSKVTASTFQF